MVAGEAEEVSNFDGLYAEAFIPQEIRSQRWFLSS